MKHASRSPAGSFRILMRVFFSLFVAAVLLGTVLLTDLLLRTLHHFFAFSYNLPNFLWILLICAVMGSAFTQFLVHYFFNPILRLAEAMRQVSGGDYTISLDTSHGFREIRSINNDFNRMVRELRSTEILKTEFISNVSHEFKTPINAIEGYVTLLQGANDTGEQETYIQKILSNTTRLSKLVGNILLLSKVDNQGIQSTSTTYRLDEQIRQSLLSLEPRWMKRETEFDVDLERIDYTGNENLLIHIWDNLLENAIKYGPQGGLVHVRLFRQNDDIIFTVDDEGPGIPEEAQKHIFDRFYQADPSRKSEGNGLGLALVERILCRIGGTIQVENLPERGCRFTVQLHPN